MLIKFQYDEVRKITFELLKILSTMKIGDKLQFTQLLISLLTKSKSYFKSVMFFINDYDEIFF